MHVYQLIDLILLQSGIERLGFNQSTEFKYELKDTYYMHLLMKIFPYSIRAFFLLRHIQEVIYLFVLYLQAVLSLCNTYEQFSV